MGPDDDGGVRASSGSPFVTSIGFSRAVRIGDRIVVSGTAPIWPDGSCPDDEAVVRDAQPASGSREAQ